jgi:hypothetical protein
MSGQINGNAGLFVADAHAFMKLHVVLVCIPSLPGTTLNAPMDVYVAPYKKFDGDLGAYYDQNNHRIYGLYQDITGTHISVPAYFCPYAKDSAQSTLLGNAAALMFTATMNGCTLGAGSQNPGGVVRVCHANAFSTGEASKHRGTDSALASQSKFQSAWATSELGGYNQDVVRVGPDFYMQDGTGIDITLNSTTFGRLLATGIWTFHTLSYRRMGGDYIYCGLRDYP